MYKKNCKKILVTKKFTSGLLKQQLSYSNKHREGVLGEDFVCVFCFFEGLRLTWIRSPWIQWTVWAAVDWPKWTKYMGSKCHTLDVMYSMFLGWLSLLGHNVTKKWMKNTLWTICHKWRVDGQLVHFLWTL